MQNEVVKLVVFVSETHGNQVREAMGKAGTGLIVISHIANQCQQGDTLKK